MRPSPTAGLPGTQRTPFPPQGDSSLKASGRELGTVDEIVVALRKSADHERVAALRRFGVTSAAFGVSLPVMRRMARSIGPDHELALALWQRPLRETRVLASLIDDPARVTEEQMGRWAEAFDSWEICDQCCQNLFWRTRFALTKSAEWTGRPEELVKRAGFVLIAMLALHDPHAPNKTFVEMFPRLLAAADDERVYVRKGASWALRQIGKRNHELRRCVLREIAPYTDGETPFSRWVARDVSRKLAPPQPGGSN